MGFARGFIKGFIGQAIDTKVAEDERLARFNEKIADLYLQEKRPAFVKNEENINRRNTLIKNEFGNNAMLFASAKGFNLSEAGTNRLLNLKGQERINFEKGIAEIDFSNYNYENNSINRALDFNEKNKFAIDTLTEGQGKVAKNTAKFLVQVPTGELKPSTFDTSTLPSMSELVGTTNVNNFDIMNRAHATEANRFAGDFDTYFYNRTLGTYNITQVDEKNPTYPLITSLLSDYDDAEARGYTGGKLQYARDKFINEKLSQVGIQNFPRPGYDNLPEAKTTAKTIDTSTLGANEQTKNLITKSKAKKFDPEKSPGKKFDPDKSPGKRYDPEKSPGIRITDESGAIMNEARQAISSISRSSTLSDEEKEEAIANVRAAAKEEIKKIGLDPDNFSF
jgi:hypothetical protein